MAGSSPADEIYTFFWCCKSVRQLVVLYKEEIFSDGRRLCDIIFSKKKKTGINGEKNKGFISWIYTYFEMTAVIIFIRDDSSSLNFLSCKLLVWHMYTTTKHMYNEYSR